MRPKQSGTLPKNIFKLKENDKATFHSPEEEWVLLAASTRESEERAGGKRVCSGFRSECAYGQQARPQLSRVGDHEDIEDSDDGDDGQRPGANRRRSHGMWKGVGLILTVMLLSLFYAMTRCL